MKNELSFLASSGLSMTSREVANLTGKRHDHVLRDIDKLASELPPNLGLGLKTNTYTDSTGKSNRMYELDRDSSYCLVAGYDATSRMRIIKRWQELEAQVASQTVFALPQQKAEAIITSELNIAKLVNVPEHIAQVEAFKSALKETGCNYLHLLSHAPAQSNITIEEEMLEPTEIAERLNLASARALNKWLEELGLQVKDGKQWVPTEDGEHHCIKHQWSKGFKSGYNLKWNVKFIRELVSKSTPSA